MLVANRVGSACRRILSEVDMFIVEAVKWETN